MGNCVSLPFSTGGGYRLCSKASARSLSAEAAEKPTEVANSPAMHAGPPGRVLAGVPSLTEPVGPGLDVTAMRGHRRWTRSALVEGQVGLHPPVVLGSSTMMIIASHCMQGQQRMLARVSRSSPSGAQHHRRRASGAEGTSSSVRAERTIDVAQVVKRWNGTTGALLTPPKSI